MKKHELNASMVVGTRDRWWLVAGAGIGVFMAQLDATVVVVALPAIQADLGVGTSAAEWVVLGYVLPLIAMTLACGRWLDTVGERAALTFSVSGFVVASVVAGLAGELTGLVGARVLQGVFAAILLTLLPAMTTMAVSPPARGRAMGVVMTLGTLGGVCGPPLGGLLVETTGWPWIFYLNVPVGVLVVVVGRTQLPAAGPLRRPERAGLVATVLLGVAAAAVLLGLSLAAGHGPGWLVLPIAAVPFVLVWLSSRGSREVVELLRSPRLGSAHLAMLCGVCAIMIMLFLVPYQLQDLIGVRPTTAGWTLLAFPAAVVVLGPVSGMLADRFGPRWIAVGGALLACCGLAALIPLDASWTPVDVAWRLALLGTGTGLFATANQTLIMTAVPRRLLGTAAATTSLTRQLATALGPALATLLWALAGHGASGMRFAMVLAAGFGLLAALATIGGTGQSRGAPVPAG